MFRRTLLAAGVAVTLVVAPIEAAGAVGTATSDLEPTRTGGSVGTTIVSLTGTLTGLSTLGSDGSESGGTILVVGSEVYRVVADGLRLPASGRVVTLHGRLTGHTLRATAVDAVASSEPALAQAAATTRSTKVLVMRLYFGSKAPKHPTTTEANKVYLKQSSAWFKAVSRGRYSTSGTVTKWLRIPGYYGCGTDVTSRATSAARHAGYNVNAYGRILMYMDCSAGWIAGQGSMPGGLVWVYGNSDLIVSVHEQGHNLGLEHAGSKVCKSSNGLTFTSGRCQSIEYGDGSDAMGNGTTGFYSAYAQYRLGWLPKYTSVSRSGTKTIDVYEPKTGGSKALRIAAGGKWYWVEYRSKAGPDHVLYPGAQGVQVRVSPASKSGRAFLLDGSPGGGDGKVWLDEYTYIPLADSDLSAVQVGSSVTTPEGVRITVLKATPGKATIAVKYGAGKPKAPAVPGTVTATPSNEAAVVSWKHPVDNGAPINRYVVTATPGGMSKTIRSNGGITTTVKFTGLHAGTTYRFNVKAVNFVGTGKASVSNTVKPTTVNPSVHITSPAAGAKVSGAVTVTATATPNPATKSPIQYVELLVDGYSVGYSDTTAPYSFEWATGWYDLGAHTLTARAYDAAGRAATSTAVKVTVVEGIKITSPGAGSTVANGTTVQFQSLVPGETILYATAYLGTASDPFQVYAGSASDGDPITLDSIAGLAHGSYVLTIEANTESGGGLYGHIAVKV